MTNQANKNSKNETAALKNKLQIALQNNEKSTIAQTIIETMCNETQVHRNGNWTQQDTLQFHRVKLLEKMLDQLSWSAQQAEEYSEKQRDRVKLARARFSGDEISTTQLQAAIAEAQSASLNAHILNDTYAAISEAHTEDTGEEYIPYNRKRGSNLTTGGTAQAIPADIAAQLAEMGLEGDTDTIANTNGTGEDGFVKKTA